MPRTLPGPRLRRMSIWRSRRSSAYSHETGCSRALVLNWSSVQPFTVLADAISSISKYQIVSYDHISWPNCPRFQNSPIRFGHAMPVFLLTVCVSESCQNQCVQTSVLFKVLRLSRSEAWRCRRTVSDKVWKDGLSTLCHPLVQLAKYFGDPWGPVVQSNSFWLVCVCVWVCSSLNIDYEHACRLKLWGSCDGTGVVSYLAFLGTQVRCIEASRRTHFVSLISNSDSYLNSSLF